MQKYCRSCDHCGECILNGDGRDCHFIDVTNKLNKDNNINYEDEINKGETNYE